MLRRLLIVSSLLATIGGAESPASAFDPDPKGYDGLLGRFVAKGRVDYRGLRLARAPLDAYLNAVGEAQPPLSMAFYLNAYNATMLKIILDHGLPAKATDIPGVFDVLKHRIAGKDWTLNELETHLRATYKDARVHFALNCGARSCPPLQPRAFTERGIERSLSAVTTSFLDSNVIIDDEKREITVVRIVAEWYKEDFEAREGSVGAFLKRWISDGKKRGALERALAAEYPIRAQTYDWNLNKR